jgi:hypothetical protein
MKKFIYLSIFTLSISIAPYLALGQDTPAADPKPTAERHEFVQRGKHAKEMALGDYVIVGAFKAEANAQHMVDELKKMDYPEVAYGYLTNKAAWYLHMGTSKNIEEAKANRDKYRKLNTFKDAWLLTVHE